MNSNSLHDHGVIVPIDSKSMLEQQQCRALEYLMFLKKKRCRKVKGQECADGRKQQVYTAKEKASSPTVSVESLMLSCTIDAMEGQDVATADIPGAFMQADMDEVVHIHIEGTMAKILLEIDKKHYEPFVKMHGRKKVIYVQLLKALYGTMQAALLFWRKLSEKLSTLGFILNPYNQCVANKIIEGKQCTILWHVDNLKISHADEKVVTSVLSMLNAEFGKEAPMTITQGKVHDYLGMKIDYSISGKVKLSMYDYIEGMLGELPDDMDSVAAMPAGNHLFQVNHENPMLLDKQECVMFHHNVAKLLLLCKRSRPDIQTAVAFLTTRVKEPDVDNYKKLSRVMRYL
jgi:hypothetical protein